MSVKGFKCTVSGENISFDSCLKCSKGYPEDCTMPPEILKGMAEESTKERGKEISITSLLGCLRCKYLTSMLDVFINPEDLYFAFRGSLAHAILEKYKAREDSIVEHRFYKDVGGITVSGKPDLIIPNLNLIRDYKTCKAVPRYNNPYSGHKEQLECYKWLIEGQVVNNCNPIVIKKLEIVYIDMEQVKICRAKKLRKVEEVESAIKEKVSIINNALTKGICPPVPNEFPNYWQCRGYCGVVAECSKLWKGDIERKVKDEVEGRNKE